MPSLEGRITARLVGLPRRERGRLFRAVEAAERAVALFHRHQAGGRPRPHPIALTPFAVPAAGVPTLARLADCVHRLQAAAPGLYRSDHAGFRSLCPLPEATAAWLGADGDRPAPWALMIRPDVGLTGGPGARRPILFETNATALAGLYNHTAGVAILKRAVFPRVLTAAERDRLGDPPDLLALTVRWVLAAARRLGRRRGLGVAFVEDATEEMVGYSEIPRLMRAFAARGVRTVHGRAEELRVAGGQVRLRDVPVDLVYRDLGYEDLDAGDTRLGGFRALHARGAVVPDSAGEFGHKGLLECLTAPDYAALFTPAERRLLRRCVPWTRVLGGRRVGDRPAAGGPAGVRPPSPHPAADQAQRRLERGGYPAGRGGSRPRLGGEDRSGSAGARGLGGPGAAAGDPPSHALPPERAGRRGAVPLFPRSFLRSRGPGPPLPGEPAADRQRGTRRGPGVRVRRGLGHG